MVESSKKQGAPMVPDPDVEVASLSCYGRGYQSQVQAKQRPAGLVRLPDPDSEIESLNEFKSTVMEGQASDGNTSK